MHLREEGNDALNYKGINVHRMRGFDYSANRQVWDGYTVRATVCLADTVSHKHKKL